jgi:hypothetical protein
MQRTLPASILLGVALVSLAGCVPRSRQGGNPAVLDLGASDGVFYRAQVFSDLTVKGYTRNSLVALRRDDIQFSGEMSRTDLMCVLNAIESTGFDKLSAAQVERDIRARSGGKRYFATDAPSTYVLSRVRGHEFDVSIYNVRSKRQRHLDVASLKTADEARSVIVEQIQRIMKLPNVHAAKNAGR